MIRKAQLKDIKDINRLLYQVHEIHALSRPDLFKKYAKSIKYIEWKNIFKIIYGLIVKRKLIVNGLNTGKVIEKSMKKACEIINLPIVAIGVDEKLALDFDTKYDNVDVWIYKRMMPKAFW